MVSPQVLGFAERNDLVPPAYSSGYSLPFAFRKSEMSLDIFISSDISAPAGFPDSPLPAPHVSRIDGVHLSERYLISGCFGHAVPPLPAARGVMNINFGP